MSPKSATDLAGDLFRRHELLEAVAAQSPITASELAAALDTSVSTVNRVVSTFETAHILERTNDGIIMTAVGETLLAETAQFLETIAQTRVLQPILSSLDAAPLPYEREWILEATVTTVTPRHPHAPLNRYSELFAGASQKRLVGDQFIVPEFGVTAAMDAMENGVHCSCVWSEQAVERMAKEYPEMMEWSARQPNLSAATTGTDAVDLAIFDDHLLVYGFDDNDIMSVLIDTTDEAALEWGHAVFEWYFENGTTVQ